MRIVTFAALVLVVLLAAPAAWADSLRCGNRLVTEGEDIDYVLHVCGEPASTHQWTEVRLRHLYYRPSRHGHLGARHHGVAVPVEVHIDEWVYNFGARRFKRKLRFENGYLVRIRELDYGY